MAKPPVIFEALRRSARITLDAVGIESSDIDCNILMCEAFGLDPSDLIVNARLPVPRNGHIRFESMLARRIKHEPIAYIIGKQAFWSLEFMVTPDVLIPRPETEGVVECALALIKKIENPVITDIGTGSGAILLSLLHERKEATGIGTDISAKALDMAKQNAILVGVADRAKFTVSDYLEAIDQHANIVVSNPPYITDKAMKELPNTVADHEPDQALRGGGDGLVAYKIIISGLSRVLSPGGMGVFEIGYDQGRAVAGLLTQYGFDDVLVDKDLAGHDRIVSGKLSA